MFKLSDAFFSKFEGKQPSWGYGILSYFTYKRTYSRLMDNGKQEEFADTLRRVTEGTFRIQENHCKKNGLPWNASKAQKTAQDFFQRMWDFKFSPPGRGMWLMGTPIVDKIGSAGLNNCFTGEQKIITSLGVYSLLELVGQEIGLLTKDGWIKSSIKSFGQQRINSVTLAPYSLSEHYKTGRKFYKKLRSNIRHTIKVTPNHRWILADGSSTTNLKTGDLIAANVNSVNKSSKLYNDGFIHGLIFADGTAGYKHVNNKTASYHIRLCGNKSKFAHLFNNVTYPDSYNGDAYCHLISDIDMKDVPENTHPEYVAGFIDGWTELDGSKTNMESVRLSSQNNHAIEWLKDYSTYAGYIITGHSIESSIETNFGERSFPLNIATLSKHDIVWGIVNIEELEEEEEVFCAQVPNVNEFTLVNGIYTGNCGFVSTENIKQDFSDPFCWAMDMLMLGVGIGFDVAGAGLFTPKRVKSTEVTYIIPDTREGWVESLRLLLDSYRFGSETIVFDYSMIRKHGEIIRGFGGVASGPEPLRELHESVRKMLSLLADIGLALTSVNITDIFNIIGKCVVAGNVRRSAEIAIGKMEDADFLEMKDYNKYAEELLSHRWASNNSSLADRLSNFKLVENGICLNGEPGLIFLQNARHYGRYKDGFIPYESDKFDDVKGFNPCGEQQLEDRELCTLVESYPANHDSAEDFYKTLKCAYLYAKTVTLVPTHNEKTNAVMMRNRRIGTSQSGVQQAISRFGLRRYLDEYCDRGYEEIRRYDRIYSRWLGVPRSIKTTTVKPSGTVSLLAGAFPGVHFTHSEYYMRTVRCSAKSPLVQILIDANYHIEYQLTDKNKLLDILVKNGYTSDDLECFIKDIRKDLVIFDMFAKAGGTVVIYFPVHEKNFSKSKFDVTIWEQLSIIREMQYYWSDNSVSCTVTIRDDDKKDLVTALEIFAPYVKTLSWLPLTNHAYEQAPYQECSAEDYNRYSSLLGHVDFSSLGEKSVAGSKFCDGESCEA